METIAQKRGYAEQEWLDYVAELRQPSQRKPEPRRRTLML